MTDTVGGLRRILVEGLFGSQRYAIRLEANKPTVLTGANGTGKSTLLGLVHAVATADVRRLAAAPLTKLELQFESHPPFQLTRRGEKPIAVEWGKHRGTITPQDFADDVPLWASEIVAGAPHADADELQTLIMDAAQNEGLSYSEYQAVWQAIRGRGQGRSASPRGPGWLAELRDILPVAFVTDQRLVTETAPRGKGRAGSTPTRLAVEAASAEIARQMRQVDSAYARVSQQQDRRFPRDVIAAMEDPDEWAAEDLRKLIDEVDERRDSLRAVGLLDTDTDYEPRIAKGSLEQEQVRPVIATFLRSTVNKMAVLEDLATRLRAFKGFLDSRYVGKHVSLSRQHGVRLQLTESEAVIRPGQLSSGEQQMFVLAYEILFRASAGTLMLIDEPEISLHVLWQDTLIDNLIEMGSAARLQFLLATHSPALLASHPELERSLDEES